MLKIIWLYLNYKFKLFILKIGLIFINKYYFFFGIGWKVKGLSLLMFCLFCILMLEEEIDIWYFLYN